MTELPWLQIHRDMERLGLLEDHREKLLELLKASENPKELWRVYCEILEKWNEIFKKEPWRGKIIINNARGEK